MKGKKRGHLNGLFLLLALPMSVWADLTVIYDSGQTRPIAPYLKSIQQIESRSAKVSASNPIKERGQLGAAQIINLLPIRSPEMTPGTITTIIASQHALDRLALGNARPFFLVGSDALSQRWLMARRGRTAALGCRRHVDSGRNRSGCAPNCSTGPRPVHNTWFGHRYRQSAGY